MKKVIDCEQYYIISFKRLQKELGIKEHITEIMRNGNNKIKIMVKR